MKNLLVSIASGKGGAGKSTVIQSAAVIVNKYYNYKTCIIDVDSQKSIFNLRKKEIEDFQKEDPSLLTEITDLVGRGKTVVDIFESNPTDLEFIGKKASEYDITFIDMPGSLDVPGVKELYFFLDYVYVPFFIDEFSYRSHLESILMIKDMFDSGKSRLKGYGVFFNKYTPYKNKKYFDALEVKFKAINIPVLSHVFENVKYQREWQSTMKAVPYSPSEKNMHSFVESLIENIGLNGNK